MYCANIRHFNSRILKWPMSPLLGGSTCLGWGEGVMWWGATIGCLCSVLASSSFLSVKPRLICSCVLCVRDQVFLSVFLEQVLFIFIHNQLENVFIVCMIQNSWCFTINCCCFEATGVLVSSNATRSPRISH